MEYDAAGPKAPIEAHRAAPGRYQNVTGFPLSARKRSVQY